MADTALCQIYPMIYYTVQGASLFSLTMVTLNRATMLFLPSKVDKVRPHIDTDKMLETQYDP